MSANTRIPVQAWRNTEIRPLKNVEQVRGVTRLTNRSTGYLVSPRLVDSLYPFIERLGASLPEKDLTINSIEIKDDRVFIHYRLGQDQTRANSSPEHEIPVTTSGLRILDIGDGRLREQLDMVYRIENPNYI